MEDPNTPMPPANPLAGMIKKQLKGPTHPLLEAAKGMSPAIQYMVRAQVKAEEKHDNFFNKKKK